MQESEQIISPGIYQHSKSGRLYNVVGCARHSETLEEYVVYHPCADPESLWVRPAQMFSEMVKIGGKMVPRFVKQ